LEKISQRWTCESCHHECVTVAWRATDPDELEPVEVRARCAVCGNVSPRAFRPGTDANTDETYTLDEWTKRGETERATRHVLDGDHLREDVAPAGDLTAAEIEQLETKVRQCQPPHLAASWNLVPPVNEWYAADVPRLLAELKRVRASNARLLAGLADLTSAGRGRPGKTRVG
jgi:hypothetical protein